MADTTLLINLTRFGDLVQMQPVISGLSGQGQRVALVCQENFAAATTLLADLDAVHVLPGARLLALLDDDWRLAAAQFLRFKNDSSNASPTRVLNLTPSLPGRLLAKALASDARLDGFALDPHGFSLTGSPWAALLIASTRHRGLSPFNLVDLFWKASGLPDEPRTNQLAEPLEEDCAKALARLQALAPEGQGYFALQLGASEDRRRYPVVRFAAASAMLAREDGLTPVLLGSKGETALAKRFREHYPQDLPLVDLTGTTSLNELAATLRLCRLLLTNDTGTMHLAAGLGLPLLAVFLATAQPWDTGPYLPGSVCLEPDMDCHPCGFGKACPHAKACRQAIAPETLVALARGRLRDGRFNAPAEVMRGARVWETRRDDKQFLDLGCLSGHEATDRTAWVRLQRHFYRQFLNEEPVSSPPAASVSPALREAVHAELVESSQLLALLQGQAQVLAVAPRETVKSKFMAVWQRLQGLWDASPRLFVLGYLFLTQTQEQQQELASLAELLARYKELVDAWLEAVTTS